MDKVIKNFKTLSYGPAPEDDKEVYSWIKGLSSPTKIFINNKFIRSSGNKKLNIINPSNKKNLGKLSVSTKKDVDLAVKAAKKAFPKWSKLSSFERSKYLYALARMIQKNSRFLSVLETIDNGKPIRETRDIDIPLVARHFYYHAGWSSKDINTKNHPIGVIGQIIPWNFPLLMLAWKVAPALATGNTVVLKPAEYTSLTALFFAELCQKANIPEGVINIVTGDGSTGEHITNHKDIKKIAFTGSTEVGKKIIYQNPDPDRKLTMELGGKSPFIVFEDADLDSAVEGIVDAIWFNQGQVCCAGSRLLVQESIEKSFIKKLKARMERLRVGNPLDKSIDIGAIVAPIQLQKINQLVKKAEKEGNKLWQPSWSCPTDGLFYPPSLFTNVTPSSFIAQVEIFGPVLTTLSFRTPSEAVAIANNTPYGLAASIWSENINLALDIAPKIKAGVIWINSTNLFDASCGFGGYKESGFGREGGSEGIRAYIKYELPILNKPRKISKKTNVKNDLIDKTPKLYIGGKQKRPDSGYSFSIYDHKNKFICDIPNANRKDIRDTVEIASKVINKQLKNFNRSQILFYLAENLQDKEKNFIELLSLLLGLDKKDALEEFNTAKERIFYYASMADKFEGHIHNPPIRGLTLAVKEPIGVIASILNNQFPLLSLVTILASNFATGNANIIIPAEKTSLIASEMYRLLETSDIPEGYINILTSKQDSLNKTISEHENIDGVWLFSESDNERKKVINYSVSNLKRYWCPKAKNVDWLNNEEIFLNEFLYESTQIKNIWIPYGE